MTKVASPTPSINPTGTADAPYSLADALAKATPGELVLLRGGEYPGAYTLKIPGVTVTPYEGELAILTGITDKASKAAWMTIEKAARGATLDRLKFLRPGDIARLYGDNWHDFGIAIEAPDATVQTCALRGMCKGIQIRGNTSTNVRIVGNSVGPTIQSTIVVATSNGVVRGGLIAYNTLEGSYREDGIQFMQNYDAADQTADVSNLGMVIFKNTIRDNNENGIDLKGAGLVIIDSNHFTRMMGSNNGLPDGNRNSFGTIMRGARTSTKRGLIRNNVIYNSACGISLFDQYKACHNTVLWNKFDYTGPGASSGNIKLDPRLPLFYGIKAAAAPVGAGTLNNVVGLHEQNFQGLPEKGNQIWTDEASLKGMLTSDRPWAFFVTLPTEDAFPLTYAMGVGQSDLLQVDDAGWFTDWFGRGDVPEEVIYVGSQEAIVTKVDYANNRLLLDRVVDWSPMMPVYWGSPAPTMGIQAPYVAPPVMETIRLQLEAEMTKDEAAALRKLLAGKNYKVSLG